MNGRAGRPDKRGSNAARKVRRAWLLLTFDPDLGDGQARCRLRLSVRCLRVVDSVTLSVDRIEVGGSYARGNIQPACKPCQDRQGGLATMQTLSSMIEEYRAARDQWEVRFEETNRTYRPGIIAEERRRERRGGRREVTDWLDDNPPPVFREWLIEWHAARQEALSASQALAEERTG